MCSCQEFREKSPKEENVTANFGSSGTQKSRDSPQADRESNNQSKTFGTTSGTSPNSETFFESNRDPFFGSTKKNKRFRPRLSEKLFGNQASKHPFFADPQAYFEDLRKDFGKKMFFDDVDAFGFPSEPQSAGTGSHRMRRGGFPFDDIRSSTARSRLDDLASRHPSMFSTMGSPNTWQDMGDMGRWGQRGRHNSGGAGSTCSSGAASGSSTASCGEEHVIPIKIVHNNSASGEGSKDNTSAAASSCGNNDTNTPPEPPRRKQQVGPQRSATDNSCQKGESSSAQGQNRSQRAQSAPPDGTPVGQSNTPQGTQLGGNSSKSKQNVGPGGVRHIPIYVEGRDSPVLPTEASSVGSPSHPQQNQKAPVFNTPPKPSRPAEHSPTPPPKKPTPPKDPIEKVQAVSEEVKALEVKVKEFEGNSKQDKNFIYLDEMLTRNLIKLDDIETEGRDDVRTARKDCIKLINSCIALLEAKIPHPAAENGIQMEVEENANNIVAVIQSQEDMSQEQLAITDKAAENATGTLPTAKSTMETPNN